MVRCVPALCQRTQSAAALHIALYRIALAALWAALCIQAQLGALCQRTQSAAALRVVLLYCGALAPLRGALCLHTQRG